MSESISNVFKLFQDAKDGDAVSLRLLKLHEGYDYELPAVFEPAKCKDKDEVTEAVSEFAYLVASFKKLGLDHCEKKSKSGTLLHVECSSNPVGKKAKAVKNLDGEGIAEECLEVMRDLSETSDLLVKMNEMEGRRLKALQGSKPKSVFQNDSTEDSKETEEEQSDDEGESDEEESESEEEEEEDVLLKSRPQGADLIREREQEKYVRNVRQRRTCADKGANVSSAQKEVQKECDERQNVTNSDADEEVLDLVCKADQGGGNSVEIQGGEAPDDLEEDREDEEVIDIDKIIFNVTQIIYKYVQV